MKDENTISEQFINQKCLIRTYSAGVWFGAVTMKEHDEIILENARRLWYWKTKTSISLSSLALYGVDEEESKICEAVPKIWLMPIEIITCSSAAISSIENAPICKAT